MLNITQLRPFFHGQTGIRFPEDILIVDQALHILDEVASSEEEFCKFINELFQIQLPTIIFFEDIEEQLSGQEYPSHVATYVSLWILGQLGKWRNMTHVITLDLSSKKNLRLPSNIGNLSNIKAMDVSSCSLQEFPANFEQLSSLEYLDISDNLLESFPKEFSQLSNLKVLLALKNGFYMNRVLCCTLIALEKLEMLDLSENELTFVPQEFRQLHQLKELALGGKELSVDFGFLGALSSLTGLILEGVSDWRRIAELSKLENLECLKISTCSEVEVPNILELLPNLKELDLSGMHFYNFEAISYSYSLFSISEQGQFVLSTKIITDNSGLFREKLLESLLRRSEEELSQITCLDLSGFELFELPSAMEKLVNLKKLDLGWTYFSKVPNVLRRLPKLQEVDLRGIDFVAAELEQAKIKLPNCKLIFNE